MASTKPRLPEPFVSSEAVDFRVSEFAADQAGSLSPYGPELEFPLPVDKLRYTHPSPADRPHLAEGR